MSRVVLFSLSALFLVCCCIPASGTFVNFEVQLAIKDDFVPFGTISGEIDENPLLFSKLIWDRPDFSQQQIEAFAALVEQNGFVRVRVPTNIQQPSATHVQAAQKARCLAQSASDEQVHLHLNPGGFITAFEYRASCQQQPAKLSVDWSQKQRIAVICQFPQTAEPLRQRVESGLEAGGLPKGTTLYPEAEDAGQGAEGAPGKKLPKRDERTWIQKNWIFLIPAGMLLLNIIGATDPTPARSGQAAGASGSAAHPAMASSARPAVTARSRKQR